MEENKNKPERKNQERRNFIKSGFAAAGLALTAAGLGKVLSGKEDSDTGEKINVLTTDGKVMEVDSGHIRKSETCCVSPSEARTGIPGKKWVMVIDLSRCKHALKCQHACQKYHHLSGMNVWLKVFRMQDAENTAPYWMPKPCMHCDKPPCVKVCPVSATYKRSDGIVLVDNQRCIGCRFCMAACPYSTRSFNWEEPQLLHETSGATYSPETGFPQKKGTVEKCDFCPDLLRQGKLPHCVTACPNGVFYMGDLNDDTVTNGDETVRFSQLMKDKSGYRLNDIIGTEPSVYYLPPVDRLFPFKDPVKEANIGKEE
ncbi:MAG: 4Fe-4S dicluster domain-containing protein [Bacteroidetes bacterium]|nr:4Fe-4S dicluster domain-containing protein [Bacteroidota bacterium]